MKEAEIAVTSLAAETSVKKSTFSDWLVPILIYVGVLLTFVVRTVLAYSFVMPRLFDIFNLVILLISGAILIRWYSILTRLDVLLVIAVGSIMGLLITFTTFYPLLPLSDPILISISHGVSLTIIFAAGLLMMRKGGPVHLNLAERDFNGTIRGVLLGLMLGVPFALFNAFAFSVMQGQAFSFQEPFLSAIRALEPSVVEEVVYRLAFLGMVWGAMKRYVPSRAVSLAALLTLIVHNYAHLSDLFVVQPLFAIIYGAIMLLLFGVPHILLALRRNLESAIAFHWMIDFVRFLLGL